MTKAKMQLGAVLVSLALLIAAALGYFVAPASMLSAVGIEATSQTEFLVRTLAAAFMGMAPAV